MTHGILKRMFSIRLLVLACCFVATCSAMLAQEKKAFVLEKATKKPIEYAAVRFLKSDSTIADYAFTDDKGMFVVKQHSNIKMVEVFLLGYRKTRVPIEKVSDKYKIYLEEESFVLKEVVVGYNRINTKSDTLVYSVAGFAQPQDRSIADVLAKMPGIEVKSNGAIKYNGLPINRFYIEGMDLMSRRYSLASKNLDRRKVKSVEVLTNHQPVAALRGKRFSENAAINLVLEDDAKMKMTGVVDAGAGYNDKENELLHDNRVVVMMFKKRVQNFSLYKGNSTGVDVTEELRPVGNSNYRTETDMEGNILNGLSASAGDIDRRRSNFNQSHLFATNHLNRLGKKATLRTQLNYMYNDSRRFSNSITEYELLDSNNKVVIVEDYNNKLINNVANAELCYELNHDRLYFRNTLKASLDYMTERGNTYLDKKQIDLWVKPNRKFLRNDFDMTIPVGNKGDVVSLVSSVSYNDMSQNLVIIDGRIQNIDYKSSQSFNEVTIRNKVFGFYVLNKFRLQHHSQQTKHGMNNHHSLKRNEYLSVVPAWSPSFSYKKDMFSLEGGLTLNWWNIKYGAEKVSKILPSVSLYSRYDLSGTTRFIMSYSYGAGYAKLLSLMQDEIYYGYRTMYKGGSPLKSSSTHRVNFNYQYSQPIKGVFFNVGINYGSSDKYSLSKTNIDANKTYITTYVPFDYKTNDLFGHFRLSKSVSWAKTLFALEGTYGTNNGKVLRMGDVIDTKGNNSTLSASISMRPISWLSIETEGRWTNYNFRYDGMSNKIDKLRTRLDLHFIFSRNLTLSMKNAFRRYMNLNRNSFFSDLSFQWKNKRIDYEVIVNNIFGKDLYEEEILRVNYHKINRYKLRPREILAKVSFNF